MTRRRGFSLIECLVVIVSGTVLLGIAVGMIHMLLKLDRGQRAMMAQRSVRTRLAKLVRADVHAAVAVQPASGRHERLVLELPEGAQAEYRVESSRIVRVRRQGGQIKNQDAFPLLRGSSARMELESQQPGALVSLVVAAGDQTPGSRALGEWRIDAVLGHDHRFEPKQER